MKKHIKKKFLLEFRPTEEKMKALEENFTYVPISEASKIKGKNIKTAMVHTFDGDIVLAFPFNDNGVNKWIPEPDPVLIYFNSAYNHWKHIIPARKTVLELVIGSSLDESLIDKLYEYFSLSAGYVTYLFTSLEAFINRMIPDDYTYKEPLKNKTEYYTKEQIERHLPFDLKIQKVLPQALGKDFAKAKPLVYQHIINLKDFRDGIMHTKAKKDGHTPYDYLHKKALTFKYKETLDAVENYINYYDPSLIEICPCDKTY